MNRLSRHLFTPSVAAITGGATVGLFGVLTERFPIWRVGLLTIVAALPALSCALIYRAAQASDDQLAHVHRAGYQLALYHVSQGLLDTPAAPPDGGEDVGQEDTQGIVILRDLPGNVRPFRPRDGKEDDHRKAV